MSGIETYSPHDTLATFNHIARLLHREQTLGLFALDDDVRFDGELARPLLDGHPLEVQNPIIEQLGAATLLKVDVVSPDDGDKSNVSRVLTLVGDNAHKGSWLSMRLDHRPNKSFGRLRTVVGSPELLSPVECQVVERPALASRVGLNSREKLSPDARLFPHIAVARALSLLGSGVLQSR